MPNPAGRPKTGPRRDYVFRFPEAELLELFLRRPQMLSPQGGVRYGAMQEYLLTLVRKDLQELRDQQGGSA